MQVSNVMVQHSSFTSVNIEDEIGRQLVIGDKIN